MAVTATVNIKIDASQATQTVGTLEADLRATRQELTKVMKTYGDNSKEADNLRKSITNLEFAITQLGGSTTDLDAKFDDLYDGALPLSGRLGEIEDRLYELALAGQQSSQEFVDLEREAGRLRQTMIQTDMRIDAMALTMTQKLSGAIGGLLGAFAAFQGATALLGVESEELEKSLLKVQGALAVLQGFDAFRQSLPSIKALGTSISLLIPGLTAASTATEGLGSAMKAIPILAIVTAIGALAVGIMDYADANSEATKKEKQAQVEKEKLKKKNEELKTAQEQENTAVAQASKEYVGLIVNLKNTVAGSRERQKQINEINATYGTTLKNISDEYKFQEQLNQSVRDYIAVQVLRIRQDQNLDKIVKSIQAEETALKKYYGALAQAKKDAKLFNVTFEEFRKGIYTSNDALTAAEIALTQAQLKTQDLTLSTEELAKEESKLTNNGKQFVAQTDKNTEALEKQKDALSNLQSLYKRQIDAEKELEAIINSRMSIQMSTLQMVDDGFGNMVKVQEAFVEYNTKYYLDLYNLEQSYRDKQYALVEQATQREVEILDQQFIDKKLTEETYIKLRRQLQIDGVKNLTETELILYGEYDKLRANDVLEFTNSYELKQDIATENTELLNNQIEILNLKFQKEQSIKDIENSILTEEEKTDLILSVKQDYFESERKLIEEQGKLQVKLLEKQRDLELENTDLTQLEKTEITAKYNKQILENQQNTQTQIQDLTNETIEVQQTQVEKLTESLDAVDEYLAALQSLFSDFESALTNLTEQNNEKRTQSIQDSLNTQTALLDSQLSQRLITQEEYDNQVQQLQQQKEQQDREIAKRTFQQNKKLNLVGATIDGARAVISTFANTPGELIIKSIAAALAGVFAATQIAVIAKSSFQAATGGIVPGMGSGEIDSVSATLAPGEAVINKKSTDQFLPILDAINQAGGGRSLMPNLPATNQNQRFEVVFPDNKQQQPVRAYVVESDISDAQKRVNRIENSTRF